MSKPKYFGPLFGTVGPHLSYEYITHTNNIDKKDQRIKDLEEALLWYADTVSDCNRCSKEGEEARSKLAKDVGRMAKNVLEDLEG
jgi:exonuclease VII small subunit